ncbi:MAG: putative regulatory protein (ArsR-family) [Acidimicrobiales bacterium]|nr:putative regulatory protein (ArsR-family) [Acidimicrobiales bacterium]
MAADLLGALGEPNRRRLLTLLGSGERSVTDLASEFDVTRSAISQHLGVLVDAGLVEARQAGRYRFYRLVPGGLAALRAEVDRFWTAELDQLAHVGRPDEGPDAAVPFDKSVFVPLPADETFAFITQPERLRRWQAVAARIDLRAGGSYRWTITPGSTAAGTVTEVEPGKRVVLSWGWEGDDGLPPGASTVTITLAPTDGGTFVRLVHEGLDEEQAANHARGWDHYLDRLVAAASGGDAGPDPWAAAPDPLDALSVAEAALAIFERVTRDLTEAEVTAQTPCPAFTVDGLIDHLAGSLERLAAAAEAPGAAVTSSAPAGATAEDRIADLAQRTLEAWRARGIEGTVSVGQDELPAEAAVGILGVELIVHAWDVATATGRSIEVAPSLAEGVLDRGRPLIAHAREREHFGAEVAVRPDAPSLDRLLAFTGRRP